MSVIVTADGSHSLLSAQFGVPYHSVHGAINESRHIYIQGALNYQIQKGLTEVHILEIGLGTGLNALLTLAESRSKNIQIYYTAIEPFPPAYKETEGLNYPLIIENGLYRQEYDEIHSLPWNVPARLGAVRSACQNSFTFLKIKKKAEDVDLPEQYDAIYFDAFGPSVQPELWSAGMCIKMFNALRPGGVLVTFCAQGAFKRGLKSAGFIIKAPPGPAGKREITQALKPPADRPAFCDENF